MVIKIVFVFLLIGSSVTSCVSLHAIDWSRLVPGKDYVSKEVVMSLNGNLSENEKESLIQKLISGIGFFEKAKHRPGTNLYLIKITNEMSVEDVVNKFSSDSRVENVGPNFIMSAI